MRTRPIPWLTTILMVVTFAFSASASVPASRRASVEISPDVQEKFHLGTPSAEDWDRRFAQLSRHFGDAFPTNQNGVVLVNIRSSLRPLEHLYYAVVGFRRPPASVPIALRLEDGRVVVILKEGVERAMVEAMWILDGRTAAVTPKRAGHDIYERLVKREFANFIGKDFSDKAVVGAFWDRFSGAFGGREGIIPEILIEVRLRANDEDLRLDPAEIADRGLCARVLRGWARLNLGRACAFADDPDAPSEWRLHGRYVSFLENQVGRGLRWEDLEPDNIRALTRRYLEIHYPGLPVVAEP